MIYSFVNKNFLFTEYTPPPPPPYNLLSITIFKNIDLF
jgi:hypothetical protein